MTIQLLSRTSIDDEQWDACVAASANSRVYGFSWYLDAVADQWKGLVLGDYEAVLPIPHNRKLVLRSIYTPIFAQQLGIYAQVALSPQMVGEFMQAIPTKKFHKISIAFTNETGILLPQKNRTPLTNLVLPLDASYEKIYEGFSKNTKRNIKKSQARNLKVIADLNSTQLLELFKQNRGAELNNPPSFYEAMGKIMTAAADQKIGTFYGAVNVHAEIEAALFVVTVGQRIYNLFPVNTAPGRENGALFLLFDELIRVYSESNNTLDFEGSMIPGVARFYGGFGSQEETYYRWEEENMNALLKWGLRVYRKTKE